MPDPVDLTSVIVDKAAKAASVETDGLKVAQRKLEELIAADEYLSRKAAAQTGGGIRFARFVNKSDYTTE